jgi:hypothetical protein
MDEHARCVRQSRNWMSALLTELGIWEINHILDDSGSLIMLEQFPNSFVKAHLHPVK